MSNTMILQLRSKDEPAYGEVFALKDIDKNLICQVFLQEGYKMSFEKFDIVKDNPTEGNIT